MLTMYNLLPLLSSTYQMGAQRTLCLGIFTCVIYKEDKTTILLYIIAKELDL